MGASNACCCNQEPPCEFQAKGQIPGGFPAAPPADQVTPPAANEYDDELVDTTGLPGGSLPSPQATRNGQHGASSALPATVLPEPSTAKSVASAAKAPAAATTKASAAAAAAAAAPVLATDAGSPSPAATSHAENPASAPTAKASTGAAPKAAAKAKVKPKAKPKESPRKVEEVQPATVTPAQKEDEEAMDKAAQERFARVGLDKPGAKIQVMLDTGWVDAGVDETKQIKDNCATGNSKFVIQVRGSVYVVDMTDVDNIIQTNPSTGKTRKLRICCD